MAGRSRAISNRGTPTRSESVGAIQCSAPYQGVAWPHSHNIVNCGGDGLFYSRRIGRAPTLAGAYGDTTSPAFTTIIGAGKLTGRLGRLRIGVLDAVTARMTGVDGQTIEPATNYGVARLDQDYNDGDGTVGALVTADDTASRCRHRFRAACHQRNRTPWRGRKLLHSAPGTCGDRSPSEWAPWEIS